MLNNLFQTFKYCLYPGDPVHPVKKDFIIFVLFNFRLPASASAAAGDFACPAILSAEAGPS